MVVGEKMKNGGIKMTKEMNIYQKLLEVRKGVEYLKREQEGAEYSYVSSGAVLTSVRDKLNEMGLILEPHVVDKKVTIAENTGRILTQLDMLYIWVNVDNPEERVEVPFYAQGVDFHEKGVGKALTYGEKYFILKYFNIPTDDVDPDAYQEKKLKSITTSQANEIYRYCEELATLRGTTKDSFVMEIQRRFSVSSIETIPVSKFKEIRNLMKSWVVQAEQKKVEKEKEREQLKNQQQAQKEKAKKARQKEEEDKKKSQEEQKQTHSQFPNNDTPLNEMEKPQTNPQVETKQTPTATQKSPTETPTPQKQNNSQQEETKDTEGYIEVTVKDVKILPNRGGQFIAVSKEYGQVGPITVYGIETMDFIDQLSPETPVLIQCEKQVRKTSKGKEVELLVLTDLKVVRK